MDHHRCFGFRSASFANCLAVLCVAAAVYLGACGPAVSPHHLGRPVGGPLAPPSSAGKPAGTTASTTSRLPAPVPSATAPAHRYGVAAENPTAAKVALEVLAKGGSAADAAVAGLLAAGVAQPVSSGIGGGGFALVWDAAKKSVTVLDFRETAPIGIRPRDYVNRPPPRGRRGVMVGVPGEVAGLSALHARWGKLPLAALIRPAAKFAADGFPISHHLARALRWNEKWIKKTPRYGRIFAPLGKLLAAGARARNPALAATLERLAVAGKQSFYRGAIARDVVATARRAASRMIDKDLHDYRVIERQPLYTRWHGYDVYTMPPPSAGGVMLLQTLNMHSREQLQTQGYGSGPYYHLLAETFRGAIADRMRVIGDPAFAKTDATKLISRKRMNRRRLRISLHRTRKAKSFPLRESGTSHFVAIDAQGNAVSVTSTVNNMFGAKLVTSGGFVLNDELDDFTPYRYNRRFAVLGRPNGPKGGARPVSSMTPTIVTRDGAVVLAIGGSGGARIATGVTQALLARLAFNRSPIQAAADMRIHTPTDGGLLVEPRATDELLVDLKKRGEFVRRRPNYSAIQLIAVSSPAGTRRIDAVSDPRKGGTGLVR